MRHKNDGTAEFDWSDPAAPSTHYEDTRLKLGAKTVAALISATLLPERVGL